MSSLKRKQTGISFISLLVLIGAAGFFVMIGLKLVPSYIEHYSIKKVLLSLENDSLINKKSPAEIRKLIQKRLKINSVYDFNPKNISFSKKQRGLEVRIAYEVREKVVGNVDMVLSFDDQVTL